MTKVRLFLAACLAVIATLGLSAQSASALGNNTTGNTVHNHWDSLGNVHVWSGSTGQYQTNLTPGNWIGTAQCFYPTKDSHSQWGGFYAAYEVRCFNTNNNYLFLHVGR